ncbi:translation initiation factor IF-3 [bacterium]|nr:translation initiation factor IF-3 [bacterium]
MPSSNLGGRAKFKSKRKTLNKKPTIFLNERCLKINELCVIDETGTNLGVMSSRNALNAAKDRGLDLLVVSLAVSPNIAKILDYGQHKYMENKRNKGANQKKQETKELKLSPRTQKHDIDTLINKAASFLKHGDKVKVTCEFKSREIAYPAIGEEKIKIIIEELSELGQTSDLIETKGKHMSVILSPKK